MLHQRYRYDKRPILKLNALQLENREIVDKKVLEGSYPFEQVNCAVCDKQDFEPLAEKDRYGLKMSIVICKSCGLVQTNPRMTQEAYNVFYNTEYRPLYVGKDKPTGDFFKRQYEKGQSIYQVLSNNGCLNFKKEQPFVLEVGCGAGGILQYFKEKGFKVKGIDLGESYINYGIKEKGLDLETGFLKDLKLEAVPDLVIYSHVVEHLLDPNEELALVYKLLPANAHLYIEVPGIRNLEKPYKHDFLLYLQNAHTYHYSNTSLDNLLKRNGFNKVMSTDFVRGIYQKSATELEQNFENDYQSTMQYLEQLEKDRSRFPMYPYSVSPYWIKTEIKNVILKTFDKLGLRPYTRKLRMMLSGK